MLPLCLAEGIGVISNNPLARGRLIRDWEEQITSIQRDDSSIRLNKVMIESDRIIVERVAQIATERNLTRSQVALAWVLQKEMITAPIVSATSLYQLDEAVGSLSVRLSQKEIESLEAPYVPRYV